MASISTPPSHNLAFSTPVAPWLTPTKRPFYPHPRPGSPDPASLCRCSVGRNSSSSSSSSDNLSPFNRRWDSEIQNILKNATKRFDSVLSWDGAQDKGGGKDAVMEKKNEKKEGDGEEDKWDWERWKKHFEIVDEQERLLSVLKSQLNRAVDREDYEDAARLKVAIAAAVTNDTVGRVMSHLNARRT